MKQASSAFKHHCILTDYFQVHSKYNKQEGRKINLVCMYKTNCIFYVNFKGESPICFFMSVHDNCVYIWLKSDGLGLRT